METKTNNYLAIFPNFKQIVDELPKKNRGKCWEILINFAFGDNIDLSKEDAMTRMVIKAIIPLIKLRKIAGVKSGTVNNPRGKNQHFKDNNEDNNEDNINLNNEDNNEDNSFIKQNKTKENNIIGMQCLDEENNKIKKIDATALENNLKNIYARDVVDDISDNEENKKSPVHSPNKYKNPPTPLKIEWEVIHLTYADFDKWFEVSGFKEKYEFIDWLNDREHWLEKQSDSIKKNWFFSTSKEISKIRGKNDK